MAETVSNLEQLRNALGIYMGAMQDMVHSRMKAQYGGTWFKDGVVPKLDEKARGLVEKAVTSKSITNASDMAKVLEPQMVKSVVLGEFKGAFGGVFANFSTTQSYLTQTVNARNTVSHTYTGDIPDDEAAEGVRAMLKLLQEAKRSEAPQVEAIWKKLTGVSAAPPVPDPNPPPAPEPKPAAGGLPYWWDVTQPWEAYQDPAAIDIAQFAATLGGVAAGTARTEYLDPVAFFSRTYFTEDVKAMVRDILSRLNGGDGESAIEMQTPFGGGKTHAQLVLYHLLTSPEESLSVEGVKEALGDSVIPSSARVAVIDGTLMGTDPVNKEDGSTVNTLWGEIAHQLSVPAFREAVSQSDFRRVAPGNTVYRKVLEAASPCLILIDELVSYLIKLKAGNTADQRLYSQTVQFIHELLSLAGDVPGVCVLVSFPKSQNEFLQINSGQLMQELGIGDTVRARADRVVSKRVPVSDSEVYILMSRRLFKPADRTKVNQVLDAYYEVYERNREKYPQEIFSSDYRRQMADAYPLHPELIDVLYKKWAAQGDFPRTRTVLQLLAQAIANEWRRKRKAHLIQSAHVDLEKERVRTRVLAALGSNVANDSVVARDIIGGDAHADGLDDRLNGRYKELGITRGVATTILLHSTGGRSHEGALPWDLYLGSVSPEVGPEYVLEVLESLEQSLWHVHRDGELLRFETKQNLFRRIAETALAQSPHTVDEALRSAMEKAYGEATGFRVLQWAGADGTIPDQAEPSVAVLASLPKYRVPEEPGKDANAAAKAIEDLWNKVGGGLRQWRNALILVAADRDAWERAEHAMREVLAYDSVLKSSGAVELTDRERQDLQTRRKEKQDSLKTSLVSAYRWVFYPNEKGDLSVVSLPAALQSDTISGRAVARLESNDYGDRKVLRAVGAMYFDAKFTPHVWKNFDDELDLAEMSRRFPQWTQLPILPNRDAVLRAAILEGIEKDIWSVVYGDKSTATYRELIENRTKFDALANPFDGATFLVRGAMRELVREQLGQKASVPPTPGPEPEPKPGPRAGGTTPPVIEVSKRHSRVRLQVSDLPVTKSVQLQPYLWKFIQEVDATSTLELTVDVSCPAGLGEDVLRDKIQQSFEMLGLKVEWQV